jgi:hypothetical protein
VSGLRGVGGGPSASVRRSRESAFEGCLGEVREADWSREGRWRAAKSRPSGFGGLTILRTCGRAQDCQSKKRVLFRRRREVSTWPLLGRNYRGRSAGNGQKGAAGRSYLAATQR